MGNTKGTNVPNTRITGELEIDHDRGVIYFHTDDEELVRKLKGQVTILRIGNLPRPIPVNVTLDIRHKHGTNWGKA